VTDFFPPREILIDLMESLSVVVEEIDERTVRASSTQRAALVSAGVAARKIYDQL